MIIAFKSINEEKPNDKWKALFNKVWPFYRIWFLSEGIHARKGYLTSITQLEAFMPEIMPVYHRLSQLAGGGDVTSRFLSMYCPPPYLSGCSQLAWTRNPQDISLIRNYDYSPKMFEGVMIRTNWLKPIIGISDCTWGLLDGMNADGLAVSLTFGGRKITGEGFGIPLVLRYVLETCSTVQQGLQTLSRIPLHMSYNITLVDKSGDFATVYLSPDRDPQIKKTPIGTNHQITVEWEDYARLTGTVEREQFLAACLANPYETKQSLIGKFLNAPLYNIHFEKAFGTLYTVNYNVSNLSVEVIWPNKVVYKSFENFTEEKVFINLKAQIQSRLTE